MRLDGGDDVERLVRERKRGDVPCRMSTFPSAIRAALVRRAMATLAAERSMPNTGRRPLRREVVDLRRAAAASARRESSASLVMGECGSVPTA